MMTFRTAKSLFTFKQFSNINLSSNIYFGRYSISAFSLKNVASKRIHTAAKGQSHETNRNDSENEFERLDINQGLKRAIMEDFGFDKMSLVQKSILSHLQNQQKENISGTDDLLVRAKTGTGKTMAFLVYALEKSLALNKSVPVFSRRSIPVFILSPTRELALQIAKEAEKLVKHLGLRVRVSVGGTPRAASVRDIQQACDILVATPGRINDLLMNEPVIKDQMKGLKVLVFDEADLLLEMGFKSQIESILEHVPDKRTTLMFSATLSNQIKDIAAFTLQKGYHHIDCVPKDDVDTHFKVKQSFSIVPTKEQLYLIQDIITSHKSQNPFGKIMIFFPSTLQVQYFTELFNSLRMPGIECMMIHSKLTQVQRSRVSDQFRRSRSSVLVSTDVSARGVDYPNVTLVLQVGLPSNREQYVHRVGRTGRAEKEGEAILILSPYEKRYLGLLSDVPIQQELRFNPAVSCQDIKRVQQMSTAIQKIDEGTRKETALSFLAFHLTHMNTSRMRKDTVIQAANDFAKGFLGLPRLPVISSSYAQKLGIFGVPGLETRRMDNILPTVSHGDRSFSKFSDMKPKTIPASRANRPSSLMKKVAAMRSFANKK